jgi:predicted GNAT family N-acyltransferase
MPGEGEARKIEEAPEKMKERENKLEKFFLLLQDSIDKEGNLLSLRYNFELSQKLEHLGFEETYQLFDDQEIMSQLKQMLTDRKTNLVDKLKSVRLLCDVSDDLFDEDREKNSVELLKFLYQTAGGSEATLLEKIYTIAAISESGYNQYVPEPRVIETGHNPGEKYDLHDAGMASLIFQFSTSAVEKLNADRADLQFYEDLLPMKDYIVSQLSPKLGGIYSRRGDLVGWFNLPSKLKGKKLPQGIKVEDVNTEGVASLMDKIVFSKTKPEELALFKIMESLPVRIEIKKQLGVELSDFPLRIQKQFLSFISLRKNEIIEKMRQFLDQTPKKESRDNRIMAFLSLEYEECLGNKILSLGENLETDAADKIFAKYAECVRKTQDIADYLHEVLGRDKKYDEEATEKIAKNLLRHGKNLLTKFADQAQEAKNQGQKIDSQVILRQLENIKTEILLFASTFKAVSTEQKVEFRDILGTELKTADSSELGDKEKTEMKKIFKENRRNYSPELLVTTLKEFEEAMNTPDKKFYLLTHNNELVSFLRFDQLPNGNLYLGSVNVRPEVRGSAIGSAMLKAALDQEASNRNLEAIVYEKNPMLKHYIKNFGFKIVGEISDYHGTGEKFLKIERPAERKAIRKRQPAPELVAAA